MGQEGIRWGDGGGGGGLGLGVGDGGGYGPTAVCLIASPHKRAFKAFPFPPPTMTR